VYSVTVLPVSRKLIYVRDQQQLCRARWNARLRVGEELKEGVEGKKLNACAGEDFGAGRSLEDLLHHSRCSLVAVTDRVFDQGAASVDQPVINTPTVNADAHDGSSEPLRALSRRVQSGFDVGEYAL
jgi:hypothetical protein